MTSNIWKSEKFQMLSPIAKIFYLYLISNKNIDENKYGIFELDIMGACKSINITVDKSYIIFDLISELKEKNMIKYDSENNYIFVSKFYKFNKSSYRGAEKTSKVLKNKIKEYKTDLWNDFFAENPDIENLKNLEFNKKRKQKTIKTDKITTIKKTISTPQKKLKREEYPQEFEQLWNNYNPYNVEKGNKKKAYSIWKNLNKDLQEQTVDQAKKYTDHCHKIGRWTKNVFKWLSDIRDNGTIEELKESTPNNQKNNECYRHDPVEFEKQNKEVMGRNNFMTFEEYRKFTIEVGTKWPEEEIIEAWKEEHLPYAPKDYQSPF